MEQTLKQHLQNKADSMLACLEFIKLNIKTETELGQYAQGKNKLEKWKFILYNYCLIPANFAFWIFVIYIIFF